MKLTEHFTFDELTSTSHNELLEANRESAKGTAPFALSLSRFLNLLKVVKNYDR